MLGQGASHGSLVAKVGPTLADVVDILYISDIVVLVCGLSGVRPKLLHCLLTFLSTAAILIFVS